jgi:hypothetical protein
MPFVIGDVDKHIKGLSDSRKEVWVRVANSALSSCQGKGGTDCEGSAIRQANSVAQRNLTEEEAMKEFADRETFDINNVPIFKAGIWNGDKFTTKDLEAIVEAFGELGFKPPLKLGHNSKQEETLIQDGLPALGWVNRLFVKGTELFADFTDIPKKLHDAIKSKSFGPVSAEIFSNFKRNGKVFSKALKAVALLGADIPAVDGVGIDGDMAENLFTESEWDEVKVYTDKDFKEVEEVVVAQPKQEEEEMSEEIKEENAKLTEEKADLEAKVAKLSQEKDKVEATLAKQQAEAKTSEIKAFTDKAKGEGKILPAFETKLIALMESASDEKICKYSDDGKEVESTQLEVIQSLIGSFPNLVEFAELAEENGGDTIASDVDLKDRKAVGIYVDKLTTEYMEKNTDVKEYSVAMTAVLGKNPKLKEAYTGE